MGSEEDDEQDVAYLQEQSLKIQQELEILSGKEPSRGGPSSSYIKGNLELKEED